MLKKLSNLLRTKAGGTLFYWLTRLYCSTFHVRLENEAEWIQYFNQGGKVLLCIWHQHLFPAILLASRYRRYRLSVMISQSRDGDIAAQIFEAAGVVGVRGSSSRGGREALKELVARMGQQRLSAHVLDGPRGPAGVVKPGAITLAVHSGAVIVPLVIRADRAWYLRSWDQFMIPKPFAHVDIIFFPKFFLSEKDKDPREFETQRRKLEALMKPYLAGRRHAL